MQCIRYIIKGREVLISPEDKELFESRRWHISDSGYAIWRGSINGKKTTLRLHRLIMNPAEGKVVDHINRNRLDNRRENLRCVSQAENTKNSERCENAKGYYKSKIDGSNHGRWVVDYRGINNTFKTEKEARDAVEQIKNGTFIKRKEIVHRYCQRCGEAKQWYGSVWTCRSCTLQRQKEYYKRKNNKRKGQK